MYTAERLMKFGRDTRLLNATPAPQLAVSWTLLYELTKRDDGAWAKADERGHIRPDSLHSQVS